MKLEPAGKIGAIRMGRAKAWSERRAYPGHVLAIEPGEPFNSSREVGIGGPAWPRQNTGFKPGTRNVARGLMASLVVDSNQTVSEHKCFTVSLHF